MRNRSKVKDREEDLEGLSLAEIDALIAQAKVRFELARTTYQKKAFFRRLTMLEAHREQTFGVSAPNRKMRARSA